MKRQREPTPPSTARSTERDGAVAGGGREALRGLSYEEGARLLSPAGADDAPVQLKEAPGGGGPLNSLGSKLDKRAGKQGEKGRKKAQSMVNRGTDLDKEIPVVEGSGEHGEEEATLTDRGHRLFWLSVAAAAEGLGFTNAGRHMRHYLENSGATLDVDVDLMVRDLATLATLHERFLTQARNRVIQLVNEDGGTTPLEQTFDGENGKETHYCDRSVSTDWFFALGGHQAWWSATCKFTPDPDQPGEGEIQGEVVTHIYDRYNWDKGNQVQLAGITISDEQLGRLHDVGIAQEYDVFGKSAPQTFQLRFIPSKKQGERGSLRDARKKKAAMMGTLETSYDEAGKHAGGRADVTRKRD